MQLEEKQLRLDQIKAENFELQREREELQRLVKELPQQAASNLVSQIVSA